MIYFTSDTHFYHAKIIEYCNRPFLNVEMMNNVLLYNWNALVKPEDTVYHLGDLTFKLDIVPKLNGKIILIRGNHDRGFSDNRLKNAGIYEVYHKPTVFEINGRSILMMHAPQEVDKLTALITLCGHVHNKWKFDNGYINVGVDVWDFKPVSLEQIEGLYS